MPLFLKQLADHSEIQAHKADINSPSQYGLLHSKVSMHYKMVKDGSESYQAYLLCDSSCTFDQLPLGEAVCGAHLERTSLLDQVDTAMPELLHTAFYLHANLERSRDAWHSETLTRCTCSIPRS